MAMRPSQVWTRGGERLRILCPFPSGRVLVVRLSSEPLVFEIPAAILTSFYALEVLV